MARTLDFTKGRDRDRIARQGSDRIVDYGLPAGLSPPRKRPSKAALRAELETATAQITRILKCVCGHSAALPITEKMAGRKFRCSKCGEVTE